MVLVDTSVWIDHLNGKSKILIDLLLEEKVYIHEMVIGELSCGKFKNRSKILKYINDLPRIEHATHAEVLQFIELNKLYGQGLGYIDAHLLASVKLSECDLLTRDQKLLQFYHAK